MIIGRHRKAVIENIKQNVHNKQFNRQAELADPTLTKKQSQQLIANFWQNKAKLNHKAIAAIIRGLFYIITPPLTTRLEIKGMNNLKKADRAFITCNHYNQLDVLPIKRLAMKTHHRLYFFVKDSNLKMHFPIAQIVRNADTLPINEDLHYLGRVLPRKIQDAFQRKSWVLVYPEQEMWFNYCKPRPLKKGAYYYAAKMRIPIISCFVEIRSTNHRELFQRNFYKTKLILHILPMIYPDSQKSISENTNLMMKQDFLQKKQAYEQAYGKKLDYNFSYGDITGYIDRKSK